MSGSSNARHLYSRCTVTLDAGVSISWAPDPDGSYASGQRHHQQEEAAYRVRLGGAAGAIEVRLDELEQAGHVFVPATDKRFDRVAQRGETTTIGERCIVCLACTPRLTDDALKALTVEIAQLVARPPYVPPPEPPPEPPPPPPPKPWWRFW